MLSAHIKFPVIGFKNMRISNKEAGNWESYILTAKIKDLPIEDLKEWLIVGVKGINMAGNVIEKVKKTLRERPKMFAIMNRGLTISASKVCLNKNTAIIETIKYAISYNFLHIALLILIPEGF